MYTTTAMTRADLAEGLQEGGGGALRRGGGGGALTPLLSKRAGVRYMEQEGGGGGPPGALKVLDISGKRPSEGQFLPKKEFVNNNFRKVQGASFRDY